MHCGSWPPLSIWRQRQKQMPNNADKDPTYAIFLKAGGSRISTASFPVSYQCHPCLQCSFEPRNQDQLADLSSPIWSNFHSLVLSPSFNPEEMLLQGYRVVTSSGVVTGHGKHDNRWWRSTNSIEDWVTLNLSWQNFFSLRPLESSGVTLQNHS